MVRFDAGRRAVRSHFGSIAPLSETQARAGRPRGAMSDLRAEHLLREVEARLEAESCNSGPKRCGEGASLALSEAPLDATGEVHAALR